MKNKNCFSLSFDQTPIGSVEFSNLESYGSPVVTQLVFVRGLVIFTSPRIYV